MGAKIFYLKEVSAMNSMYLRAWWVLASRGAAAIVFGVLAIVWPDLTLLGLVSLFAAYALIAGAVSVIGAAKNRERDEDWWIPLLLGLAGIGAGIVALVHPALTAMVLVLLVGANALVTGVLDVAAAVRLRKAIRNEWLLILNGAASAIFGMLVFLFPEPGALAIVWLLSFYALGTGVLLLAAAARVRQQRGRAGKEAGVERRVTPDRRMHAAHT